MAQVTLNELDPLRKAVLKTTYELKPCPFCGQDMARFVTCHEVEACGEFNRCNNEGSYAVICSFLYRGCGSSSGFYQTREEAARAWNQRAGGAHGSV